VLFRSKEKTAFTKWQKDAAPVWGKLNNGAPLPAIAVRAKHDQIKVNQLTANAGSDQERYGILVDYLTSTRPDLARYKSNYLALPPNSSNQQMMRNLIYGNVLSQYDAAIRAYKTSHGIK